MGIHSNLVHTEVILLNFIEKSVAEHYTITPVITEYESYGVISPHSIRLSVRIFKLP